MINEATQSTVKNSSLRKNNKSGYTGVNWNKRYNKWQSSMTVDGKSKHLGYFDNLEDAISARKDAEIKYNFVPATPPLNINHRNDLTQEMLKDLLHYDPETGEFTRLVKTNSNIKIGSIAGSHNGSGYIEIKINNKTYSAHRLAFLYMNGELPEKYLQVDHINHVRDDNRWVNLRLVTHQDNLKNRTMNKNNKSGYTGVCWHKAANKWQARISIGGERIYLGYFDNLDDAIAARKAAEIKFAFHKNHGTIS